MSGWESKMGLIGDTLEIPFERRKNLACALAGWIHFPAHPAKFLVKEPLGSLFVNASEKRSHSGRCWSEPVIHQSPLARMQYEL